MHTRACPRRLNSRRQRVRRWWRYLSQRVASRRCISRQVATLCTASDIGLSLVCIRWRRETRQLKFHQSNTNNWCMNATRAIIYRSRRITRRTTRLVAILNFGILSGFYSATTMTTATATVVATATATARSDGWILDSDRSANVL